MDEGPETEEAPIQATQGCLWATFATGGGGSAGTGAGGLGGGAVEAGGVPGAGAGGCAPGGSFWQLFDQVDFAGPSPLDTLLENPDCPIELLLREEEVLQELRARHRGLLERLSRPDAALALIGYVASEPAPDPSAPSSPRAAGGSRGLGSAFTAAQLLSCDVPELFAAWVDPDHPEMLERFWGYLETPPACMSPVTAGYFAGAALSLAERHPEEVASYFARKGRDVMLQRFLDRMHLKSIADLFACLWPTFSPAHVVERLLEMLRDPSSSRDVQEHVASVLGEMLARAQAIGLPNELLGLLIAESTVDTLVDLVLAAEPGRSSAAASMLAAAVFYAGGGPGTPPHPESAASFSSLNPQQELLGPGMRVPAMPPAPPEQDGLPPGLSRTPPAMGSRSYTGTFSEPEDKRCLQLVASICRHFEGIREFLEEAVGQPGPQAGAVPRRQRRVAASNALEVIILLSLLVKAHRETALEAFQKEATVLPLCLKLLLFQRWSSLLHNAVAMLLGEVLSGTEAVTALVFRSFFSTGGLIETVVEEYRRYREACARGGSQVGYMGQLHQVARSLADFAARAPSLRELLHGVPGWADCVLPAVEHAARLQAEELGGGVPAELRALATSGGAWSDAAGQGDSREGDRGQHPSEMPWSEERSGLLETFSIEVHDYLAEPAKALPLSEVIPEHNCKDPVPTTLGSTNVAPAAFALGIPSPGGEGNGTMIMVKGAVPPQPPPPPAPPLSPVPPPTSAFEAGPLVEEVLDPTALCKDALPQIGSPPLSPVAVRMPGRVSCCALL